MNTTAPQSNTQPTPYSYVDEYMPPQASQPVQPQTPPPTAVATPAPVVTPTPIQPVQPQKAVEQPPVVQQKSEAASELLEDQNIFTLLGVLDGTEDQRDEFLDELQQVIWEDFLEYDVKLLVTKSEQDELTVLLEDSKSKDLEKQEKVVVFLEKLIPDLEEIMLEKALELKEEMARERVKSYKNLYQGQSEVLEKVAKAEELMNTNKWYSAAQLLNTVK